PDTPGSVRRPADPRAVSAIPEPEVHPGALRADATGPLARPPRLGSRSRAAGSPGPRRHRRLCQRTASHGRGGTQRVHRARLAARAIVLRFFRLRAGRTGEADEPPVTAGLP